jgi:hypothetical protein
MKKLFLYLGCFMLIIHSAHGQAKRLTTDVKTTWVGNTFGGGDKWVQNFVEQTKVYPDGSINVKCNWDEAGRTNGIYIPCDVTGNQDVGADSRTAVDKQGNTWTIVNFYGRFINYDSTHAIPTGANAPVIRCSDGRTISTVADPSAIAVDNKGRLLVADNGPDQNIKIFDISATPVVTSTFGDQGGVYSGTPGMVAPKKLYGIRGLGTDSIGNLWVACSGFPSQAGGTDLRHYDTLGNMNCNLMGLIFVQSSDADPASPGDVYLNNERTHVNYDGAPGDWSFTSETINPFQYPDDPRLMMTMESTWMRRINGQKYMFQTNMYAEMLTVFRFDGEIAVPMAMFTIGWNGQWDKYPWQIDKRPTWDANANPSRRWMWLDKNGDGQVTSDEFSIYDLSYPYNAGICVTGNGTVIIGGRHILSFAPNGADAHGVLQYSIASMTDRPLPDAPDLGDATRMKYVDSTDVMYIASGPGYPNFTTIYQFTNWSTGGVLRRVIQTGLPIGESLTADEKYVYAAGVQNGAYTSLQGEVDVWDAQSGLPVGYFVPGAEVSGESGWIDLTYGLNTFRRPGTGQRVVLAEEDWKGKNIIYQWNDHWMPPPVDSLILLSPKDSANYTSGSPVTLSAYIDDGRNNTTIGKVVFYVDSLKIDSIPAAYGQYSYVWSNGPVGNYTFTAKAYDTAGHLITQSAPAHFNITYLPDLTPVSISWDPATVSSGTAVNFKVKVKNIGQGATPAGVIIGGVFAIDGNNVNWSDTHDTALAAGDSVVLAANNGVNGTPVWIATPGKHTVTFLVDDINRITESNEDNNLYTTTICVAGGGPAIHISSPANNDTLYAGTDDSIKVDAYKCGELLSSVVYYDGDRLIGRSTIPPYGILWKHPTEGPHTLIARATDAEGNIVSDTSHIFAKPFPTGGILRQEYDNIDGTAVSDLENASVFPDNPSSVSILTDLFEGPSNIGDNYGAKYSGYITAPQTGNYTFWIASDDNSELSLSTSEDPAGKRKIASVPLWTNPRDWYAYPDQQSAPIFLVAGQRYYIEALHKEGGGGDNLAVGWTLPDSTEEKPILAQHIVPFNTPFVQSMTLTNATGSADIKVLRPVDTVNLATLKSWLLNIRAATAPLKTGSVTFAINGLRIGVDNTTPYMLYPRAWLPAIPGATYTITATPYSLANGKGEAGIPLTVKVKAVYDPSCLPYGEGKDGDKDRDAFELFPNPAGFTGNRVTVSYNLPVNEKALIEVTNALGSTVIRRSVQGYEGRNTEVLDVAGLGSGLYYVNLTIAGGHKSRKLLVIR